MNENDTSAKDLISQILVMSQFAEDNDNSGTAKRLREYAQRIEDEGAYSAALTKFYEEAMYWKGLIDVYFPEKKKEWDKLVKSARYLSKQEMIKRGLIRRCILSRLIQR